MFDCAALGWVGFGYMDWHACMEIGVWEKGVGFVDTIWSILHF